MSDASKNTSATETDNDELDVVEFPFAGVKVMPTPDQWKAWTKTAGDQPVPEWLAELADDTAVRLAYDERSFPVVIELRSPVKVSSQQTLTEISVREGRLSDMQGIKIGGEIATDDLIKIAARMTGQTTVTIGKLGARDAGEVMALALDFYGRSLGAGRKRSP